MLLAQDKIIYLNIPKLLYLDIKLCVHKDVSVMVEEDIALHHHDHYYIIRVCKIYSRAIRSELGLLQPIVRKAHNVFSSVWGDTHPGT